MGVWGTAISFNDTFADIYSEFFDLYDNGLEVNEISDKLILKYQQVIDDIDDSNNFWFALAKAQWECKSLSQEVYNRVKEVIETDADLLIWRKLEADEKEIKKRKTVLDKFLADLKTERTKVKPRKKKNIRRPVFEKGDCLTFKLENGNFGGAVVLEAIKNSEYGYNLIATTRINQVNKPVKKDFQDAEILMVDYGNLDNKPSVTWYLPIRHKQIAHLIEKVDNIEVQVMYDLNNSLFGHIADFDMHIIHAVDEQLKSAQTHLRPLTKQTIKKLIKKKWWKFGSKA